MCSGRQAECWSCVMFGFPAARGQERASTATSLSLNLPCWHVTSWQSSALADRPARSERAHSNLARTLNMSALRKGPQEV